MVYPEQVAKVKSGYESWNEWRQANPDIRPDLRGSDLRGANLSRMNLSEANLSGANLSWAMLCGGEPVGGCSKGRGPEGSGPEGSAAERSKPRPALFMKSGASTNLLSKPEHVVTRAEFVFMPSLISKQLVRAKGGFRRATTHLC